MPLPHGSSIRLLCARQFRFVICWLLLAVVLCGCGKPRATSSSDDVDSTAEADSKDAKKQIVPVRRDVKDLDGNWVLLVTGPGRDGELHDNFLWIMRISKGSDGKYACSMVDTSNDTLEPVIESAEINDKTVSLKIKNKTATIRFDGELDGIAVRGTLSNGPQELFIARLLPTEAEKLTGYVTSAFPPAKDIFQKAISSMNGKPQPKVILQLARENRTSPIALARISELVAVHGPMGFDDETVLALIDQYVDLAKVWGPRMQAQAELTSAQQLVASGRLPKEALKHLAEGERLLGAEAEVLKSRIQQMRDQAEIFVSLAKSQSKSEEDRAAAYAELQESIKKQPFNADILLALAEYSAETRQLDTAIDYYSTLVALPLLEQLILARRAGQPAGDPTPGDVLKKLWIEKNGNDDGLPSRLEEIYNERITALKTEIKAALPAPPTEVGNHTVLVELFTGCQMPPAIATEIATDALRETFPDSKVVTLRYHQHIPGPDGLVNQDGEDRAAYYEFGKVPGLALDGAILDTDKTGVAGYLQFSGNAYAVERVIVDARLKQSTPIRIELTGKIENGELSIDAEVTGATEEELPSLRLRLALAEENIHAKFPNGIRDHAMVVREMPGGARGIAPKKGELKFSYSMPVGDLQQHIDDYLKLYEKGKKFEFPAEAKPPVRGPLHLVAWVQNDKLDTQHPEIGRAILQTAIVPVTGMLPEPPAVPETTTQPEPSSQESATPPPPALPKD